MKFFHPPHLYCVTTLPSKTNAPQFFSVRKLVIKERSSFVILPISNNLVCKLLLANKVNKHNTT